MIEMVATSHSTPDGIRLCFEITDLNGLHQAHLFTTIEYLDAPDLSILDCKTHWTAAAGLLNLSQTN